MSEHVLQEIVTLVVSNIFWRACNLIPPFQVKIFQIFPVLVTKQEISIFFSKNGFRRTKTSQKAVHWAHLTYEVTIDVK